MALFLDPDFRRDDGVGSQDDKVESRDDDGIMSRDNNLYKNLLAIVGFIPAISCTLTRTRLHGQAV